MTWGAIGAAAIGVVGGAMASGGKSSGGTVSKDPWAAAQPWLTANLQTGQNLQGYYQQNPFNPIQQTSYGNLLGMNDYINQIVPGLLGQMSNQSGFDPSNPTARPKAYQFPNMPFYNGTQGLLGSGNMNTNPAFNPFAPTGVLAPAAPAAPGTPTPGSWEDIVAQAQRSAVDNGSPGGA